MAIQTNKGLPLNNGYIDLKNFNMQDGCPFNWDGIKLDLVTIMAYADGKYIGQFEQKNDGIIIKMESNN